MFMVPMSTMKTRFRGKYILHFLISVNKETSLFSVIDNHFHTQKRVFFDSTNVGSLIRCRHLFLPGFKYLVNSSLLNLDPSGQR